MIALKMAGKNGEPILDLTKEQRMIMLKSMQKHGISATNEQKSLLLGVSDREIRRYTKEMREKEAREGQL